MSIFDMARHWPEPDWLKNPIDFEFRPLRTYADFAAVTDLVAHVNMRGGILADQDDRESRLDAVGAQQIRDARPVFPAQLRGDGLAVDDTRAQLALATNFAPGCPMASACLTESRAIMRAYQAMTLGESFSLTMSA